MHGSDDFSSKAVAAARTNAGLREVTLLFGWNKNLQHTQYPKSIGSVIYGVLDQTGHANVAWRKLNENSFQWAAAAAATCIK